MRHDRFIQTRLVNTRNRVEQLVMIVDQLLLRALPRRFARIVDGLPVLQVCELCGITFETWQSFSFLDTNTQTELKWVGTGSK